MGWLHAWRANGVLSTTWELPKVRRCFKPSPDAVAEITGLLAPGDIRR